MAYNFRLTAAGLLLLGSVIPMTTSQAESPGSTPPPAPVPTFSSGGVTLKILNASKSPDDRGVTVSAALTNDTQQDIKVSILGELHAVSNAGDQLLVDGRSITSISYCNAAGGVAGLVKYCVHNKAEDGYPEFTEIDKGSTTPIPLLYTLMNGDSFKGTKITFAMTLAVVPIGDQSGTSPLAPSKHSSSRVKIISAGLPLVPVD